MRWDIFCKVIDNHGDIGVCWHLACDLASRRESVRLWVDDASALAWMAPGGHPGVEVLAWGLSRHAAPADVVVEAFGCELEPAFVAAMAAQADGGRAPCWLNLEYLSAEDYVERCHGLPSPVLSGPGRGLTKRFFYPGFTARTGGLLRERDLTRRQSGFDRSAWLAAQGIPSDDGARLVSLFCYEPAALADWLRQLAVQPEPARLLVTSGRAQAAVQALLAAGLDVEGVKLSWLPPLPQPEYDHLLWACDLNFVRGEDSLVRALWAGRPFVWHIYPQDDDAHHAKLAAFLDWLQAPPAWRAFHAVWNGIEAGPLPEPQWRPWAAAAAAARDRLLRQDDLATQLIRLVGETR
jgi:uncharacterized repeat protein (TIGR03837 family)